MKNKYNITSEDGRLETEEQLKKKCPTSVYLKVIKIKKQD